MARTQPFSGRLTTLDDALASAMRSEMAKRRLTPPALAMLIEMDVQTLRRYLNAIRPTPVATLGKVAEALDIAPSELMAEAEKLLAAQIPTAAERATAMKAKYRANSRTAAEQLATPPGGLEWLTGETAARLQAILEQQRVTDDDRRATGSPDPRS